MNYSLRIHLWRNFIIGCIQTKALTRLQNEPQAPNVFKIRFLTLKYSIYQKYYFIIYFSTFKQPPNIRVNTWLKFQLRCGHSGKLCGGVTHQFHFPLLSVPVFCHLLWTRAQVTPPLRASDLSDLPPFPVSPSILVHPTNFIIMLQNCTLKW